METIKQENLEIWNQIKTPPKDALKKIRGGRLSGMTDISPQWRLEMLTQLFGPVGIGWYYTIDKQWLEPGGTAEKQWGLCQEICAFANISLYIKDGTEWSMPIPGTGGSSFVAAEKNGPHTSDECYKMAITDALSVACKCLGMASDIYRGLADGSKYNQPEPKQEIKHKGTKNQELQYSSLLDQVLACETVEALDQFATDNAGEIKNMLGDSEYIGMLREDIRAHRENLSKVKAAA